MTESREFLYITFDTSDGLSILDEKTLRAQAAYFNKNLDKPLNIDFEKASLHLVKKMIRLAGDDFREL